MSSRITIAIVSLLGLSGSELLAQNPCDSVNKLSITVEGRSTGNPDSMRISLSSSATAGTAAGALQQCKSKSDSAVELIRGLGIQDLKITTGAFRFSTPSAANVFSMAQRAVEPSGTMVTQSLFVDVSDIANKSKSQLATIASQVLDAANTGGVGIGSRPRSVQVAMQGKIGQAVQYLVLDGSAMRSAALKDAMEKVAVQKREFEQAGLMIGDLVNATARFAKHQVGGWQPMDPESDEGRKEGAVYSSVPDKATFKQQVTMVYEIVGK